MIADTEPQPHSRPCSATMSTGTRVTASATAPGKSIRCSRRVCGRLSTRITTPKAMMPMGTLTRNTQRQPSMPTMLAWPAKAPPTTGPTTLAVPNTARKKPW